MVDCIFCKIIDGTISCLKISENDEVLSFLSLEGHPLVIPKKHIKDIYELDDQTGAAIMKEAIKISKAVKKGLYCDGINLVQANEQAAHQEVFHFHLHIKPRWKNDSTIFHWTTEAEDESSKKIIADKIKAALN